MQSPSSYHSLVFLFGLIIMGFYVLGIFFPEQLWATHNLRLLPQGVRLAILGLAVIALCSPFWWQAGWQRLVTLPKLNKRQKNGLFLLIASVMALLFYQFPIARDHYGDAIYIKQSLDLTIPQWDIRLLWDFFQPDWLSSKVGLRTYYQINNFFTWLSGRNGVEVAPVIGSVIGGLFVFLWLWLTDLFLVRKGWKILFALVGLTAPFLVVFMGHYETYSHSYTAMLLWMSVLGLYFKTESKKWLLASPFVFLLVLQTHITYWLLLPGLLMALAWHYRDRYPKLENYLTWRVFFRYALPVMMVLGGIAYFFIFANHDGPRKFSKEEFENTLFLPLYTAEPAPYDRYNLFSLNHLLDYFNLLFMWSGAVLLLLVPPLTFLRQKVSWNQPLILISASTALIFFLVFFVLNPLLGLVLDWDLFIAPGLVVLPFLVFVYAQLEEHLSLRFLLGPTLGLAMLSATFLFINPVPSLLAPHLELIGKRSFKTYWIGCSTMLIGATQLEEGEEEQQAKLQQIIEDLAPFATPGHDKEYANLLLENGRYLRRTQKKAEAISYFERAYEYSPLLGRNLFFLTISQFEAGNIEAAYTYSEHLAQIRYPPYERTLRMATHIALTAKEYQSAANHVVTYLGQWQDNEVMLEIERRLRTGDRIETLVNLFGER